MFESLTLEEKMLLVERISILTLTQQFKELFKAIARELVQEDRDSLIVIKDIIVRRIKKILQKELYNMLELVYIKPPRGLKFLKDRGVLLPNKQLVPQEIRNKAQKIINKIVKLLVYQSKISLFKFLLLIKLVKLGALRDKRLKN